MSLERFLKAVAKAGHQPDAATAPPSVQAANPDAFLYFRIDRKMVKVLLRDVLYIEGMKNFVKIHRASGPPLVVKQTVAGLEKMLSESNFLRIHRSFIVALDKIRTYSPRHMEVPGAELPIGRLFRGRAEEVLGGGLPGRCKSPPRPFASNRGPEGPSGCRTTQARSRQGGRPKSLQKEVLAKMQAANMCLQ